MMIPPNNKTTEDAVIGIMLLYPEEDCSYISPEDFHDPVNFKLVETMKKMREEKKPIDSITVYNQLKEDKWNFSPQELAEKMTGVFTATYLPQYSVKLKELRRQREAMRLGDELIQLSAGEPSALIDYAEKLKSIAKIGVKDSSSVSYDDVNSAYEQVLSRMGKKIYGYSWGSQFSFLDDNTKGLLKKKIYRIGAPSGVGKTQFIYNVIPELLKQKNPDGTDLKIAFFTLENAKEDTLTAIMCKHAKINQFKLNEGLVEGNWDYLVGLKNRLFVIDDVYDLDEIFSRVMQIKPDIVILDYISYVTIKKFTDGDKYTEYARKVVPFAKSQNVVWIDLSNLANDTQTNEEIRFKPKFYGSSVLVNNSDVNIMIMRNEEFKKTKDNVMKNRFDFKPDDIDYFKTRNMLDMVITKNRWGPPGFETIYGVNQDNGGIYQELDKSALDNLWAKYG